MYAVEFFLDTPIENYVKEIWTGLKLKGISSQMAYISDVRPHITVGLYDAELPIEGFIKKFDIYCCDIHQIEIKFDILATFPTSGTIFTSATITSEFFDVHRNFYIGLEEYNMYANEFYIPDRWDPHCTFATNLNQNELMKAFEYCLGQFKPFKGNITEIGVVKLEFLDGKCISSKTIFSKILNNECLYLRRSNL